VRRVPHQIALKITASYDEATLGKNGLLGLVGTDGIIRVTRIGQTAHPPAPPALTSVPTFAPQDSGSGILEGNEWFADKRTRFVGRDAVEKYPLIALAGLDEQEALAPYWANRAAAISAAIWNTAQCEHCKWRTTRQRARYGQQKCANYFCAGP
jgi:hypothetical protein